MIAGAVLALLLRADGAHAVRHETASCIETISEALLHKVRSHPGRGAGVFSWMVVLHEMRSLQCVVQRIVQCMASLRPTLCVVAHGMRNPCATRLPACLPGSLVLACSSSPLCAMPSLPPPCSRWAIAPPIAPSSPIPAPAVIAAPLLIPLPRDVGTLTLTSNPKPRHHPHPPRPPFKPRHHPHPRRSPFTASAPPSPSTSPFAASPPPSPSMLILYSLATTLTLDAPPLSRHYSLCSTALALRRCRRTTDRRQARSAFSSTTLWSR